ncbi:MAG TPA: 6,7-dimethyl-8-ribityllumazine synthase [Candidatus Handelsmanbacteria bacterium]|nr:6,7-dimethyl-8-ribityllumazine synthase [Candidatus Handelsmanbacteria bacterium]
MPKVHEGQLDAKGRKFGIVVSRFNDLVTTRLLGGALDCIKRHRGDDDDIEIAWVPGAFELPIVAKKLATTGRFDVVMCLGAIVRSDTPHFDYVAGESAKGIARVGLDTGVPVIFGVITADTVDQAVQRAGVKAGNRGWDAAMNAIEMATLMAELG